MDSKDFLTIDEAHQAGRMCRRQLYRHLSDGTIRAVKMGRRTLVPRAEIQRFLASLPAYQPASAA